MPLSPRGDGDGAVVARLALEVTFPVAKWLLLVAAQDYGLDAVAIGRLHRMPDRLYIDRDDVDAVYRSTPALVPSVAPPGQRSGRLPQQRVSPPPAPVSRGARR